MLGDPISMTLSEDKRTAYLRLPGYLLEPGYVKRTVCLQEIVPGYKGPMINIDFDDSARAIGIEVLVFDADLDV